MKLVVYKEKETKESYWSNCMNIYVIGFFKKWSQKYADCWDIIKWLLLLKQIFIDIFEVIKLIIRLSVRIGTLEVKR